MKRVFTGASGDSVGQRDGARRMPPARRKFADRPEFFAVAKAKVAHIAVEAVYFDRLGWGFGRSFPSRRRERRFRAFAAHRSDNMQRPRCALIKAALDRECAL